MLSVHVEREGSTAYCIVLVLIAENTNIDSEIFSRDQGVGGKTLVVDACPDSITPPS